MLDTLVNFPSAVGVSTSLFPRNASEPGAPPLHKDTEIGSAAKTTLKQKKTRKQVSSKLDYQNMLMHLIPNIFYNTLDEGLALFVSCLGFQVLYREDNLAVIQRDGAKAYLIASPEFAAKDRPQITIETDTIEALYLEVSTNHPEIFHPNSRTVSQKPWGALEFAVLDNTGVCIVFRQFK